MLQKRMDDSRVLHSAFPVPAGQLQLWIMGCGGHVYFFYFELTPF